MKSQIKLGTVFGVELGLHYSWLIIAILITFSLVAQFHADNPHWSNSLVWLIAFITGVLFFAGIFIHEMSHARVRGRKGGRPVKLSTKEVRTIRALLKTGDMPVTEIAARFGIARSMLYRTILRPAV